MIERTVLEIARQRFWAWQRRTAPTPRNQLRETDQLLGAVEECRLREIKLIPTHIWRRIVHLLGQLDGHYTEKLGIDRSVERTAEVLFEAQEDLMVAARSRRRARGGKVIPLFRP
ncbi:MAG: hypothetical protein E6I99_08180 [Chloroflexi bacterium]|nr:MAG: hypothetical protein E6I99_08180 [Chloroflexota bacterium]TMD82152.1 MAG: hypothetical protein E6I74_09750 [Chloroflexota bacterium]